MKSTPVLSLLLFLQGSLSPSATATCTDVQDVTKDGKCVICYDKATKKIIMVRAVNETE